MSSSNSSHYVAGRDLYYVNFSFDRLVSELTRAFRLVNAPFDYDAENSNFTVNCLPGEFEVILQNAFRLMAFTNRNSGQGVFARGNLKKKDLRAEFKIWSADKKFQWLLFQYFNSFPGVDVTRVLDHDATPADVVIHLPA